jgi:hypothetical protein
LAISRKSAQTQGQLTFLSAEPPASHSASLESGSDWMIRAATSRLNFLPWLDAFAPAGSFGKMSPAFFPPSQARSATFSPSSITFQNAGMGGPMGFVTLNIAEHLDMRKLSLKDGGVCSLSDILETGAQPPQRFLTPKACAGILRRAGKRGKALPPQLQAALQEAAGLAPISTLTEASLLPPPLPR